MTSNITTHDHSIDLCSDLCHDDMHVDGDSCPTCSGWLAGCTHQTPSATAKTAPPPPSSAEVGAPGQEVDEQGPPKAARPSALAAHQRVTWDGPLTAVQDVGDTDWTVTVGLTEEAARQLARDLTRRHMADLVLLSRLTAKGHRVPHGADALEVEARLAGALQSMATTQWVLTPGQAEELTEQLEDAQADPDECAVGTCSANAIAGGSYCAPHDERG